MTYGRPTWDPAQYNRYGGQRLRAALELLGRVEHPDPRLIHDLGTGTGDVARIMAARWPGATVVGSDLSEDMLAMAEAEGGPVSWERFDITGWDPDEPIDIIYANAVLHWLPDHGALFPRLAGHLADGGVLAVQMPLSWHEPSHQLMREVLASGPYGSADLRDRYDRRPFAEPVWYLDTLAPLVGELDVWTTRYYQRLEGPDPVLEWVRGSALRPILEELADEERAAFLASYAPRLTQAYPRRRDGTTVFPFPRLFLVARR